jgi:hypothetical protein
LKTESARFSIRALAFASSDEIVGVNPDDEQSEVTMAVVVNVQFFSRRQNTNQGDDQYRIWIPRGDADLIAQHVPPLKAALQADSTWSQRVDVSWNNGNSPNQMSFSCSSIQRMRHLPRCLTGLATAFALSAEQGPLSPAGPTRSAAGSRLVRRRVAPEWPQNEKRGGLVLS